MPRQACSRHARQSEALSELSVVTLAASLINNFQIQRAVQICQLHDPAESSIWNNKLLAVGTDSCGPTDNIRYQYIYIRNILPCQLVGVHLLIECARFSVTPKLPKT